MKLSTNPAMHILAVRDGYAGLIFAPASSGGGLVRIYMPCPVKEKLLQDIRRRFGRNIVLMTAAKLDSAAAAAAAFLQSYYSGSTQPAAHDAAAKQAQSLLDWGQVSDFDRQVLQYTAGIAWGRTLTYGQVARGIGRPGAARAVGAALGRNPWPVLIPCHRVLGAGGELTGFSGFGGIAEKKRMLALELLALNLSRSVPFAV